MKIIQYKVVLINSMSVVLFLAAFFFLLFNSEIIDAANETQLTPALENPGHVHVPEWFKVSFLDLHEDVEEAADDNKRLLVFFLQDGCPYCKKLLEDNFGQRAIAEKTQQYFDVVTINIWGDREVAVGDKVFTEKQFAAALKVQYTPTLLFFNENKKVIYRANGYYPPEKFDTVLDYVGQRMEKDLPYRDYLAKIDPQPAKGELHTEVINIDNPGNLEQALEKDKHLLVMFEQKKCAACDELHDDMFTRLESEELLSRFNVTLLDMWSDETITRPDGEKVKISDWAKQLDIKYAPSMVYFNDQGEEVFRSDAYLKSFHVFSVMDYVSTSAYKEYPNFQRYIDVRADEMRAQGIEVNLME